MLSPLPPMHRIVTSHNDQGQTIVARDTQMSTELLPHGAGSVLIWSIDTSPAELASPDDKDAAAINFITDGSVFRIVDIPPHSVGALHRTISLDYIIVQTGSVVLTLEKRVQDKSEPGRIRYPAGDDAWVG